jgi:hypothetical protein
MKNLDKKEGYLNRHLNPLPTDNVYPIEFLYDDYDNQHVYKGLWYPALSDNYTENNIPLQGYLGTVKVKEPLDQKFYAWKQNDSEFIYYKLLKYEKFLEP